MSLGPCEPHAVCSVVFIQFWVKYIYITCRSSKLGPMNSPVSICFFAHPSNIFSWRAERFCNFYLPWQCRGSSQCTEELSHRFPTPPRSWKDLLFFNNKDIIYKTLKGILLFKNSPGAQVFWVLVQYDNIENIYFFWILWLNCYNLSQYLKLKAFDERLKK